VAETRRNGAARRLGAWLSGLPGAAARAVALALLLALVPAAAGAGSHAKASAHHSKSNDDNSGAGGGANDNNAAPSASAGGNANTGGNGNGNGNAQKSSGGLESNPFNASPDRPSVGLGFNNNGAAVSASIPLGVSHRAPGRDNDHVGHPKITLPFAAFSRGAGGGHGVGGPSHGPGAGTHALAYGNAGGGHMGGLGGGIGDRGHALTSRLINSVASTYSDKFTNRLSHSLTSHVGEHATLANRSANTIVNDRFVGFGAGAIEPRVFSVPAFGETRYVPNEIVVGVPEGVTPQQMAAIAQRNGLAPVDSGTQDASGLTLQRWRIADARPLADAIRGLQGEADIQTASPNYRFKLAQAAGVSTAAVDGFSQQYVPAKLHLPQAHRLSTGQGVLVAIIDTGIDRLHPEIAGAIAGTFDAIGAREPPDAHGTAIAGAIIAHGRLVGAAPAARILAIRAFTTVGPDAEATTMTVVRSIEYAMAQGARVINMSFAGARDPVIGRSLAQARRKGIVLVAAAGNAGPDSAPLYPAADPNVIAVSATDVDDHLLDVSNRGRQIALAAPGVDVLLPAPGARYQIATGTSFAAAHVAGIAALMIAKNPQLAPEQVRHILAATARDLGPKGRDDLYGAGLADALKAVTAAVNSGGQTVASNGAAVP
jgi:subtilisin family serine protease